MTISTENYQLDSDLTLSTPSDSPFSIPAVALALTKENNQLIECRFTFKVSLELYQRIETEALFNLKPEMRRPLSAGNFLPSPDIFIEIGLQPNLLPQPIERAKDANVAATYILNLSQEQPDNCNLYTWNKRSTFSIGVYLGLILTQVALLIYGDRTTSPQRGQVRHKRGNGSGIRRSLEALLCHRKRGIPHHIVGGHPEQPGRE